MNNVINLIEQIRSSSRTMVRELGFMNSTLAADRRPILILLH